MIIPLVNLKPQIDSLGLQLANALNSTISSCRFLDGEQVIGFQREFADFCRTEHCIAVDSGTTALELALEALGVGRGDDVITSVLSFVATAGAICKIGAKPVFADVQKDTLNIDPEQIDDLYSPYTKALLPVHLYGRPAEMNPIRHFAYRNDLAVIEDAAQAHGARYGSKRVGSISDAGCFSFYPSKNLGAFGDAGAITTNHRQVAEYISKARNHGRLSWNVHGLIGGTHRMDEIQAAVLRIKLKYLEEWNDQRRSRVALYTNCLDTEELPIKIVTGLSSGREVSAHHLFVIRVPERDRLQAWLHQNGVQTGIHYPLPLHLQPCFGFLGYKEGMFPVAEQACREILSLPLYPELPLDDVDHIAALVNEFYRSVV